MKKITRKSIEFAGRTLSFEVGRVAQQATSEVLVRYGDTTVLAAVTTGQEDTKKDYFPLSVDYQERLYAGGRIKGSRWVKREGRSTDAETLSARLIDRSIRPLFPKDFRREVQVVILVLSIDMENDPDVLGIIAASAALATSNIPWSGPVSGVRIGLNNGELVVNPKNGNKSSAELDLVVASTDQLIDMIEAGAKQVPDATVLKALELGFAENAKVVSFINDLVKEVGQTKITLSPKTPPAQLVKSIETKLAPKILEFITHSASHEGGSLNDLIAAASDGLEDADKSFVPGIVESLLHKTIRNRVLSKDERSDDRKLDEVRPLNIEVGVLPRVHGSAIFQRGQTQALTVTTLGAPSLSQSLESAEGEETKRYMHHYYFPPFSTGETGRMGGPSRREIGHGALAERGLLPVIPDESSFPYAVRVVSEILSSNGSSSMASTCGSTLSLMDAGVPILAPVSGISMGLVTSDDYPAKTSSYKLLTDIIGMEDHYGDMDFKIAGTETGITAIQLDVKVPGLTLQICQETFTRSRVAREQVLAAMLKVLPASRPSLSQYAPKISTTSIPVDKIGELIGPGGKVIKQLMADTETAIDVRDDGMVFITGASSDGVSQALSWISGLGREVIPGEIYEGTVARIQPFGAFVTILPGKDGLVHVSQMANDYVSDPFAVVSEGQTVKVWVTEIDSQGRINLSMLFDAAGQPLVKVREERPRNEGFRPTGPRRDDRRRPGRNRF